MPYTSAAQTLLTRYRNAQEANSEALASTIQRLFVDMIEQDDIDGSAAAWMRRALPATMSSRRRAASLAQTYYAALRRIEAPDAPRYTVPTIRELTEGAEDAARASLWITGPKRLQDNLDKILDPTERDPDWAPKPDPDMPVAVEISEETFELARAEAAETSAASAYRHANNGGRGQMLENIKRDPVALGYIRVTGANCCHFCALLASRGAVYQEDSFKASDALFSGDGTDKVHDGCNCQMMGVYRREDFRTERAKKDDELYRAVVADGFSGYAALNEFRNRYDRNAA